MICLKVPGFLDTNMDAKCPDISLQKLKLHLHVVSTCGRTLDLKVSLYYILYLYCRNVDMIRMKRKNSISIVCVQCQHFIPVSGLHIWKKGKVVIVYMCIHVGQLIIQNENTALSF